VLAELARVATELGKSRTTVTKKRACHKNCHTTRPETETRIVTVSLSTSPSKLPWPYKPEAVGNLKQPVLSHPTDRSTKSSLMGSQFYFKKNTITASIDN
jgi:hypothetical protein